MLVDDGTEEVVMVSECPNCRRLFCVQCKVGRLVQTLNEMTLFSGIHNYLWVFVYNILVFIILCLLHMS